MLASRNNTHKRYIHHIYAENSATGSSGEEDRRKGRQTPPKNNKEFHQLRCQMSRKRLKPKEEQNPQNMEAPGKPIQYKPVSTLLKIVRSYQGKTEALVKIILVKIIHLFISSHLQKLISVRNSISRLRKAFFYINYI